MHKTTHTHTVNTHTIQHKIPHNKHALRAQSKHAHATHDNNTRTTRPSLTTRPWVAPSSLRSAGARCLRASTSQTGRAAAWSSRASPSAPPTTPRSGCSARWSGALGNSSGAFPALRRTPIIRLGDGLGLEEVASDDESAGLKARRRMEDGSAGCRHGGVAEGTCSGGTHCPQNGGPMRLGDSTTSSPRLPATKPCQPPSPFAQPPTPHPPRCWMTSCGPAPQG
jgi:hypothetical protein